MRRHYELNPRNRFYYRASFTGTSEAIMVPQLDLPVSVGANPGTGSVRVQYSRSCPSEVDANTAAWWNWVEGSVTAPTDTLFEGITALRGVASGTATMEIVI